MAAAVVEFAGDEVLSRWLAELNNTARWENYCDGSARFQHNCARSSEAALA
jgi:hypothetical protein